MMQVKRRQTGRHGMRLAAAVTAITITAMLGISAAPALTEDDENDQGYIIILNAETLEQAEIPVEKGEPEEEGQGYYNIPLAEEVQDILFGCCEEYGLEPELVLGLIDVESQFVDSAISGTNDYGLMQVNESNFDWIEEDFGRDLDFLNPADNIQAGCYCLSICMEFSGGDLEKALMAYNMGTGSALSAWENGITSNDYSQAVIAAAGKYE